MSTLKIALLQIAPTGCLEGNLEKGIAACRQAKAMGADIALFPEMWSCGYNICEPPVKEWQCKAIRLNNVFLAQYQALAAELDMAIAVTLLEAYEPKPRNTMMLFDRFGEQKMVYAKVHTCDFGAEKDLTAGDEFFVTDLDTEKGIAMKNNKDLFLSALEYRLLLVFINNRGIVLTRNQLLDAIWDVAGEYVNDNTLTVYIKRLREKIEDDPANPQIILTVRGIGYKVEV